MILCYAVYRKGEKSHLLHL